jgi:hypothetical protein
MFQALYRILSPLGKIGRRIAGNELLARDVSPKRRFGAYCGDKSVQPYRSGDPLHRRTAQETNIATML